MSPIKLSPKQRELLLKAAADEDYFSASTGLMDGPKRTAEKLQELGLGRYFFWGSGMFQANRAGRALAAQLQDETPAA
jgi:hypothetical protein